VGASTVNTSGFAAAHTRRIIALSDLHIGGESDPMLGHPELLIHFLDQLSGYKPAANEQLELVINGDFIDFLAESPGEAWSSTEFAAIEKFEAVTKRNSAIFNALACCISKQWHFTILLGNHDIELAYPKVRDALFRALGTTPHSCLFLAGNEAYRVGDLLIEHGNRYDPWNAIDHDGLRQIVSACSRGEAPPAELKICPGSDLVQHVINPLKERYHFIDLLKPEEKLVTLLLTTLEPQLKWDLKVIFRGSTNYINNVYRSARWKAFSPGPQPYERHLVSHTSSLESDPVPRDVAAAFAEELKQQESARVEVSVPHWIQRFLLDKKESLKARLEKGEGIEPERLKKLQVALHHIVRNDASFVETDRTGAYVEAARQMIGADVAKVIVMGHTHLARNVEIDNGLYINTGTWADLLRVDHALLEENDAARLGLMNWLRALAFDDLKGIRVCEPAYADIRLDAAGHLTGKPLLRRHQDGASFE
jgi:UDP-2,3-diacylglucosamine pyrophosphatase LpxH